MIPPAEALPAYLAAIAGREPASSFIEIRPLTPEGRPAERAFLPVDRLADVESLVSRVALRLNVFVGAAPRTRREGNAAAVARVWTLWADIDSAAELEAARAFRPLPAIVIRTGSGGGHLYWPLSEPLSPADAQRANRRLALALRADMRCTDSSRVLRPPGTRNFKHQPSREVRCTRLTGELFTAAGVVATLPDSAHYVRRPRACAAAGAAAPERVLDGLARTVRTAKPGNRNSALFWSLCRVIERRDQLDETLALQELRAAALEAGLGEPEIAATIRSALGRAGAVA